MRKLSKNEAEILFKGMLAVQNVVDNVNPPPTPGRGKRRRESAWERGLVAEIIHGFHGGFLPAIIKSEIEDAFKTGCMDIFEIIQDAQKVFVAPPHTMFSRAVIQARKSYLKLSSGGVEPTKKMVIKDISKALGEQATFSTAAAARWTEVLEAAGLKHLPAGKPQRGKTAHGNG